MERRHHAVDPGGQPRRLRRAVQRREHLGRRLVGPLQRRQAEQDGPLRVFVDGQRRQPGELLRVSFRLSFGACSLLFGDCRPGGVGSSCGCACLRSRLLSAVAVVVACTCAKPAADDRHDERRAETTTTAVGGSNWSRDSRRPGTGAGRRPSRSGSGRRMTPRARAARPGRGSWGHHRR